MENIVMEFSHEATKQLMGLAYNLNSSNEAVVQNALSLYSFVAGHLAFPGKALGIINQSSNNEIEKIIDVPGVKKLYTSAS